MSFEDRVLSGLKLQRQLQPHEIAYINKRDLLELISFMRKSSELSLH